MAITLVDVGTTANDGTGDPLRTAFQTVNTALTAVNNAVVVGTGTTTFKDDSGTYGVAVASNGDVTFTNAGATTGMTWDASAVSNAGGLGIGVTAPGAPIHAVGAGAYVGKFVSSTTGAYLSLTDATTTAGNGIVSVGAVGDTLVFRANNAQRVVVKSNTVNIASLPTSAAGLATGDLWNNSGVLNVA